MSQHPAENENNTTQSDKTTKILETVESMIENLTKSETVELSEVAAKTTENIFTVLVKAGGKPVAMILAIAVVIVATAIPIVAFRLSPSQINLPATTSQVKQLE